MAAASWKEPHSIALKCPCWKCVESLGYMLLTSFRSWLSYLRPQGDSRELLVRNGKTDGKVTVGHGALQWGIAWDPLRFPDRLIKGYMSSTEKATQSARRGPWAQVLSEGVISCGRISHPRGCAGQNHLCSGSNKNWGEILILTHGFFFLFYKIFQKGLFYF